ncbi:sigma factor-like helix-turn-helix DNA-binding protein [Paenibacillus sp. MER 99-2]|uniref:sigma factor-like helix-turn-helix DNA-binding protein n=1 Tax=Paenibacillus sp. MER 99-2 TaxID=2939572 RepID=UPI00203FE74C|nr:sigma factor-like helix-turn-helix DNA-binding protein [Paenibacillus sp. MER 99-2]MCM3170867.1 DUF4145 domain-containing protein [Paenibacillus sp. MER 99-2]
MTQPGFRFLNELNMELASLAKEAENSIWLNPRGTLMQGRLYAELLATTVSVHEKVEPVYAIKQIERLHKLAREGLISESIRDKFEWLRKNGNTAAHDSREIHVDTALTAHRHIFELAIWYVELYGSVAIELPPYQMPVQPVESIVRPIEAPPALDQEMMQKVIADQLEAKLLPTLDEKFRSIEEVLVQISEKQLAATLEKSPSIVTHFNEKNIHSPKKEYAEILIQNNGKLEIAVVLGQESLDLVDKRSFGGALWVVGGWELKEILNRWNAEGIYFRFARNGSNSTRRKPAWFMMGKNPSAERWVTWLSNEDQTSIGSESEITVLQNTDIDVVEVGEVVESAPQLSESISDVKVPPPSPVIQPTEEVVFITNTEHYGSVKVPERLIHQKIKGFTSSRLADLSETYGIEMFGGWTEEKLLELYDQQSKLLHDVMVQLWFFGFQFEDKLGRFLKLQHEPQGETIGILKEGITLDEILPPHACRMLQRFGIIQSDQLSGIPVYSLKWLLKEGHEEIISVLRNVEQAEHVEDKLNEVHAKSSENEGEKFLRLNGMELLLPANLRSKPIRDLSFQGCASLIRGIQENWNIVTLEELPEVLSILPSKIKGVGSTAVQKFYDQLRGLIQRSDDQNPPETEQGSVVSEKIKLDARVGNTGLIQWKMEQYVVDEAVMHTRLDEIMYKGLSNLIFELQQSGIHTIEFLPGKFEKLLTLPQVGVTMVDKFYRHLCSKLNEIRQQQLLDEQWKLLSQEERLDQAIQRTTDIWQPWINGDDLSRGKDRNREVMRYRWQNQNGKRKPTLEEVGQQFGFTRERTRQIIKAQHAKLKEDMVLIERELRAAISGGNGFYNFSLDASSFENDLIVESLEISGITHFNGWWTTHSLEKTDALKEQLVRLLKQNYKGILIEAAIEQEVLERLIIDDHVPVQLMKIWAEDTIHSINDRYFILSNSTKADKVEMLLRMYPEGIEIYKRVDELLENAESLWPGDFEKKRDIVSVVSRDEYADTAYLWGRGVYIHHSYVQPELPLIRGISIEIEKLLEVRSPITVRHIFTKFETELLHAQVPNEYALYTLLRKHGSSGLQLRKFPHIWHENDGFQLSNAEMIKSFIREHNTAVSKEQLRKEFVVGRGWKWFTLDFNLSTDGDFVRSDFGMIGLKEFYPLSSSKYLPLSNRLNELLVQAPVVHIKRLYEEMLDYCKMHGIESTYTLYDLLQTEEAELTNFNFVRYPLVAVADQESENLTLQMLTEQYILDQGGIVSRSQVWDWLTQELGATENTLDIVLSNSRDLFYYTRGKNGEYIHKNNLAWKQEHEEKLMSWVHRTLRKSNGELKPYILSLELMIQEQLPRLADQLPWSEDLLIDVLKKSKQFLLIGSYDVIIVARESATIQNEMDFITHIIMHAFQGNVPERELYRKLAELRYSKDGKLLYESLSALESGVAPFELRDGVLMIK